MFLLNHILTTIYLGYKAFLITLSTCYNERNEAEALGLFLQATEKEYLATILMLSEVFTAIRPLVFILQRSQTRINISDIPSIVDAARQRLGLILTNEDARTVFNVTKFNEMIDIMEDITLSFPGNIIILLFLLIFLFKFS